MDGLGFLLLNVEQLGCYSVAACWRSSEELTRSWEQMLLIGSIKRNLESLNQKAVTRFLHRWWTTDGNNWGFPS